MINCKQFSVGDANRSQTWPSYRLISLLFLFLVQQSSMSTNNFGTGNIIAVDAFSNWSKMFPKRFKKIRRIHNIIFGVSNSISIRRASVLQQQSSAASNSNHCHNCHNQPEKLAAATKNEMGTRLVDATNTSEKNYLQASMKSRKGESENNSGSIVTNQQIRQIESGEGDENGTLNGSADCRSINNSTDLDNTNSIITATNQSSMKTIEKTAKSKQNATSNMIITNGEDVDTKKDEQPTLTRTKITIHNYYDSNRNKTWTALNTSKRKFRAFLRYKNVRYISDLDIITIVISLPNHDVDDSNSNNVDNSFLSSRDCTTHCTPGTNTNFVPINPTGDVTKESTVKEIGKNMLDRLREEWRQKWNAGQLLTDRTELLATYQSDKTKIAADRKSEVDLGLANKEMTKSNKNMNIRSKRGGFEDLLHIYTERLIAILQDEENDIVADKIIAPDDGFKSNNGRIRRSWKDLLLSSSLSSTQTKQKTEHYTNVDKFFSDNRSDRANSKKSLNEDNGSDGPDNSGGNDAVVQQRLLVQWLMKNYGKKQTLDLIANDDFYNSQPHCEHISRLNHFLSWFRDNYPYYYDQCSSCGASMKDCNNEGDSDDNSEHKPQTQLEDSRNNTSNNPLHNSMTDSHENFKNTAEINHIENETIGSDDSFDDTGIVDDSTFIGYIYPSQDELLGKSSRTELYQCFKCNAYTRFPRYNAIYNIIQNQRGRCGEYSMLLYRLLRSLNHTVRWIIDYSDHVWVEILLPIQQENEKHIKVNHNDVINRKKLNGTTDTDYRNKFQWTHLDPCEASVNEPLLYQGWGKKQSYILALYAPLESLTSNGKRSITLNGQNHYLESFSALKNNTARSPNPASYLNLPAIPLIEDVTNQYTTDSWDSIYQRREETQEEVQLIIDTAKSDLQIKLQNYFLNYTFCE